MIENPRRQVILIALVALIALVFTIQDDPNLGLDLSGGTQLVYELPVEQAMEAGQLDENADPDRVIEETLAIIRDRIDPTGVLDAVITRRGDRQFLIELPDVGKAEAQVIKSQIQNLGKLEMRAIAADGYDGTDELGAPIEYDLAEERKRLETWLDDTAADGKTNRVKLAEDPNHLQQFNGLPRDKGGRLNQKWLVWYPATVYPSFREPSTKWDFALSRGEREYNVVPVFTDADYAAGPGEDYDSRNKPFLVELFPINMHEVHFTGEDLDASGVYKGNDPESGMPAVFYALNGEKAGDYADFSTKYRDTPSPIILNGVVRTAPAFRGRIYGSGIITGGFTDQEASALAKVIKTGSLQVRPRLISDRVIGATLGEKSIELGWKSIAVGGMVVLLFIMAYYRLAGLVAFAGIALNVFLIYGAVLFIRATITLPGIAGLVLTMGMAVDANILIYERIREELARGKDMLRAARAGFDRAMVTILDANVTTFLVGVVLYNVGVGPVRGFAVTLMIGILTTLFTAFFVSRVVFHYLIEKGVVKDFKVAGWFSNTEIDFVKAGRVAFTASIVAVVLGAGYFFTVPSDKKLGLDFTGGAALELALKQPQSAEELRVRLGKDQAPEFFAEFPDPVINTIGETDEDKRSTEFSVKLKLREELRQRVGEEKEAALDAGQDFDPFYKQQLRQILAPVLVAEAFTFVGSAESPGALDTAEIHVHIQRPVQVALARQTIKASLGEAAEAVPLDSQDENAETTDALLVNFPVPPDTTDTEITKRVIEAFATLKDVDGKLVQLSDPIPNAEDIGPRMVGQLRTAAIGAMIISLFLIVMYIRLRFHEYKYGFAAVAALVHDVVITLTIVVLAHSLGLVSAEIDLAMIAAFLTIIGYSINDTIVIFDRIRENVSENARLGETKETFPQTINRSINQTLSRTILTSGTTLFVVLAQFVVNRNSGSALEGFSFALLAGIVSGTYSTMFIASPLVLWMRNRETENNASAAAAAVRSGKADVKVKSTA